VTERRSTILGWIIAFKAAKAIALTTLGIALLTTRRSDPVDLVIRLALAVHLPLTSRLLDRLIAALSNLTLAKQTILAITAFGYAVLMGTEGFALHFASRGHPGSRSSPRVPSSPSKSTKSSASLI
jgi:hypothetical protein